YSLYAFYMNHFGTAESHTMDFFWELATLIVVMLLGHWIEMKAVGNAGDALQKMAELLPNTAVVLNEMEREGKLNLPKWPRATSYRSEPETIYPWTVSSHPAVRLWTRRLLQGSHVTSKRSQTIL